MRGGAECYWTVRRIEQADRGAVGLQPAMLINDANGHEAGDNVLRHMAEVMKGSLSAGDIGARYGEKGSPRC